MIEQLEKWVSESNMLTELLDAHRTTLDTSIELDILAKLTTCGQFCSLCL